jgi:hypothetical protein
MQDTSELRHCVQAERQQTAALGNDLTPWMTLDLENFFRSDIRDGKESRATKM